MVDARERYLSVAENLIADRGFNGASMRDFARGAGTSLSNLYNHFDSKAGLLMALLEEANQDLLDRLEKATDETSPDPSDQLVAVTTAYVEFVVDRQKAALIALSEFRYLNGDYRRRQVRNRDRTESIFGGIVADGVRARSFLTPFPSHVTRAILTMLSHISTWYRPDGPLDGAEIARIQSRYALALVEAPIDHSATSPATRARSEL